MALPLKHILEKMNGICGMPDKLQLQLLHSIDRAEFPKNHVLLRPGDICEYLYYIEHGMLSSHEVDDDKEYCNWMMFPGDIATAVQSFNYRIPSNEIVRTVHPSTLHLLSYQHLEQFTSDFTEFGNIRQRLTDQYHLQARTMDVKRKRPPEQFYEYLREAYAEHFHLIPRKLLASYMGISETSLYAIIKNSPTKK